MNEETTMDELESLNEEQEMDVDFEETSDDTEEVVEEAGDEELTKAQELATNYKIRAEKAESKLKEKSATGEPATPKKEEDQSNSQDTLSREEAKLYARGLSDDQVDKVAQIAKIEGISLDEAVNSDYYTVWSEKLEKEVKQEKSQLRASRGGKVEVKKTLDTPGLSDAEHKALWNE